MGGRKPPWSDLPQELLSAIANFLTSNPISIVTFRSICQSWRNSCSPLPNSSILSPLLPLSIPLRPNSYHCIFDSSRSSCSFLSLTIIYALHRPHQLSSGTESSGLLPDTWILFVDEFSSGKLSIRKPFLSASYTTPINFPNINLIDFNVAELGRFHNLSYSFDSGYYSNRNYKLSKPRFCLTNGIRKVVMFPNVSAVITLHDDGTLGMYRLNVGINEEISECESKHDGKGFRFDDIVEFKGRVLGIDRRGRVYEITYHSSLMTPFVLPIAGGGGRRKRLVESLGLLYLVVRCKEELGESDNKKPKYKVYELNEVRKKWCEIASLGDRCFSFGPNFSFSASAQDFGSCMKSCILFVKNSFRTYSGYDDDYKDFPKLKNSENSELDIGVWHLDDADHLGATESYPDHSDSLWPPPSWIWNVDRLKRIGIVETAMNEMFFRFAGHLKSNLESPVDSSDTIGQRRYLEAGKISLEVGTDLIKLRTRVNTYSEEETEFMRDLRESMEILNKVESLFKQSGTSSHGTTEERPGWPDNLMTSSTCEEDLLRSTMSKLRKRDACLFSIEEQSSKVKMYLNSLLGPIQTQ